MTDETCRVEWCTEPRVEGALFCGSAGKGHMTDNWMGRIRRLANDQFVLDSGPQSREPAAEWGKQWNRSGV